MHSWLRKTKSSTPDPNALTPFERAAFQCIIAATFHDVGAISLSRQLRSWLDYPGIKARVIPDWFQRSLEYGHVRLRPQRFIGGQFGFASSSSPLPYAFTINSGGKFVGWVLLLVAQAIQEVRFHFPGLSHELQYPTPEDLSVRSLASTDERHYWRERAATSHSDFRNIAECVCDIVENGAMGADVIVPAPFAAAQDAIFGIPTPQIYRAFLGWANGCRLNDLTIQGTEEYRGRLFTISSCRYLKIADDSRDTYVIQEADGTLTDSVLAMRHGTATLRTAYDNVFLLCNANITRKRGAT